MSRRNKAPPTIAELDAEDRRNAERYAAEREARLDAPVSRRELLEAIKETRKHFSGSGYELHDAVARALQHLENFLE